MKLHENFFVCFLFILAGAVLFLLIIYDPAVLPQNCSIYNQSIILKSNQI